MAGPWGQSDELFRCLECKPVEISTHFLIAAIALTIIALICILIFMLRDKQ